MKLAEIQDCRAVALQRMKDATAASMSGGGRSGANYDLDAIRKDLTYWDRQLRLVTGNNAGISGVGTFG